MSEAFLTADAPDEFLDPLMVFTFMNDPTILLPTIGTIIDRATITQHLLTYPNDPFNQKDDLTIDMVQPAKETQGKQGCQDGKEIIL